MLSIINKEKGIKHFVLAIVLMAGVAPQASVNKDLVYSSNHCQAGDIVAQTYFVNHFYDFDNYTIIRQGRDITALILRSKTQTH